MRSSKEKDNTKLC